MEKGLYIKTYGCQSNVYDSQKIIDTLSPYGYKVKEDIKESDTIILNTCHIREKATEKLYSDLGRIRKIKDKRETQNKKTTVIVAGCVAQAEGENIIKRSKTIDIIVGTHAICSLPDMISKFHKEQRPKINIEFSNIPKFDKITTNTANKSLSAIIAVQEGCDRFCTFCCVPYTRGAEQSRPVSSIIEETHKLCENGAKEIILSGQNINAYHGIKPDGTESTLADLIHEISKIPSVWRIKYITSHPNYMDMDLINAHKDIKKLSPFLHLPLQSGSDRILKQMNRQHTFDDYSVVIDLLRQKCPDIAFSSDFIVGFPGESDDDFVKTIKAINHVQYAQAYSFKYSIRPGTPAAYMEDQIDEKTKNERLKIIQQLILEQQLAFNKSFKNQTMEILIEKQGKQERQKSGKSIYNQSVIINNCDNKIGEIVNVKISDGFQNCLQGTIQK